MDLKFEWDPGKDASNEAEHGLAFSIAVTVYKDPHHLEEDSTRPEHGERRIKAVGMGGEAVIAVVLTDRGDVRRIITARRARRDERARYDQGKIASRWERRSGNE